MPGFIIDLDGTMYAGKNPIPRADEFIRSIKAKGWPFLYLTNNSSAPPSLVARKLASITGIEAAGEDVLTSALAAARYIVEQQRGQRVLCIGEAGLEQALDEAGLERTKEHPDYVVQGIDRAFDYGKLKFAVDAIRGGAVFVQTNPDHLIPTESGPIPGAGSIAAAIRTAAQTEPVVIGKPSPIMFGYAVEHLGLPPEEIWVIGDNILTDIRGGKQAGCKTALTLTGITNSAEADKLIQETGIIPDLVCSDLMELFERLQ